MADFFSFQDDLPSTAAADGIERVLLLELLERSTEAILIVDPQGRLVNVNPRACELLGYDRAALLAMDITDLLVPQERARFTAAHLQTGTWTYLHRDGNPISVQVSAKPLTEGYWVGFLHNLRDSFDATLRQRPEAAAQQALDALMECIPEGVIIADAPDVTIRWVSRYAQQMAGRSPEVLEGISVDVLAENWGVFHLDGTTLARDEELPLVRAVQQGEVVINEEWILQRPDGQQIMALCNAGPIYNSASEITGGVIAWRDISERKRAEMLLRSSEERFQYLVANIPGVIYQYVLHPDGTDAFTYISARCREIYEYEPEVLLQDFGIIWRMIHPDDVDRVQAVNTASAEQLQPFEIEFRILPPSGKLKWIQVLSLPKPQPDGNLIWDGIVTDISDRKIAVLNEQFLNDLDHCLRQCSTAAEMDWEVVSSVGEYLNGDRCLWHEIDWETRSTTVDRPWHRDDIPDVTGTYALEEYFTPEQLHLFAAGQPLIVDDVTTHPGTAPYAQNLLLLQAAAIVGVPCIHAGRWVAVLAVNAKTPRHWRSDEVALLQETVVRLWAMIEQTRAVQALEAEQECTRLATEAAELGMWFWDLVKDELVWTDRCKALFGLAPDAPISYKGFLNALHPQDRDRTHAAVTRTLTENVEYNTEYRTRWPDGQIYWIAAKGRAFYNASGQPVRMMGTVQDITERKQVEADLRQRSDHIQLLYETTRDLLSTEQPLSLVDRLFTKLQSLVGLDVYFNYLLDEKRQQLHLGFYGGISNEMAQQIKWLDIGRAVCGTVAQQRCQIVQADLQHSTDPNTELVRSLGLTAYSCQPLIAQGKLFGTLGFGSRSRTQFTPAETQLFQSICDQIAIALERSELMSSLQQQTEQLIWSNHLKDEFLAALSHELRTPLNPILGWTKMLRGQKLTPIKAAQALETVERNVRQQIALVDDLLDVSAVIQGRLKIEFRPVDLVLVMNSAIATVQFAAQAKGISISLQGLPSLSVKGDSDRLQQVFWNVLSNAIKFTPLGGRVEVRLEKQEGTGNREQETGNRELLEKQDAAPFSAEPSALSPLSALITVSDSGIGISPEFLPHVFDHFRQAEGGTTRRYGGLGLGLSIVRHLVELHGGTVSVESSGLGQGATFTVRLPLLNPPHSRIPVDLSSHRLNAGAGSPANHPANDSPGGAEFSSRSAPSTGHHLKGVRILLVDDEPDNLELLRFILSEAGAIVTAFTTAPEALKFLAQTPPDLLISDIGMPQMNGYEFIQRVRALAPGQGGQVRAIALTAFAQPADQERTIAAGYQSHISKPIDPFDVVETITQIIAEPLLILDR